MVFFCFVVVVRYLLSPKERKSKYDFCLTLRYLVSGSSDHVGFNML